MTEPAPPRPPETGWITKRDGRIEPFDPDKISRALFAATESLGRPDPFLARELTDSILHFLAVEGDLAAATTAQVAEVIAKIVRELGQPALGKAFQEGQRVKAEQKPPVAPPIALPAQFADPGIYSDPLALRAAIASAWQREYSLREVFGRDLVAAHREGLIQLRDLEAPFELAACVLDGEAVRGAGLLEAIDQIRRQAGVCIALDAPEHNLLHAADVNLATRVFVRDLRLGLRATGLGAIVNLNASDPPSWATHLAAGPLFAEQREVADGARLLDLSEQLLEQLLVAFAGSGPHAWLRIDWHLSERDFLPANQLRLGRLARAANEAAIIAFAFDRPRQAVSLAEGIDRQHPAVLLNVGVDLPRLLGLTGVSSDPSVFLKRLGSLVRMALSAARQKRAFLRRHAQREPAVTRSFLLDRARLVLVPLGLDAVVEQLSGRPLSAGGAALTLARQVLECISETLGADRRRSHLESCIDDPLGSPISPLEPHGELMTFDPAAPVHKQLRTVGDLHATIGAGTATLRPPADVRTETAEIMEWLDYAWHHTSIHRLQIRRPGPHAVESQGWWESLVDS